MTDGGIEYLGEESILNAMRGGACMALCSAFWMPVAGAQAPAYPAKTVRFIVPFTPGTGIDILARASGQKLSERWAQPVVVDNRPGASGNIGTDALAKSAPD